MWTKLEVVEMPLANEAKYQPQGVIGCNHIACCSTSPY